MQCPNCGYSFGRYHVGLDAFKKKGSSCRRCAARLAPTPGSVAVSLLLCIAVLLISIALLYGAYHLFIVKPGTASLALSRYDQRALVGALSVVALIEVALFVTILNTCVRFKINHSVKGHSPTNGDRILMRRHDIAYVGGRYSARESTFDSLAGAIEHLRQDGLHPGSADRMYHKQESNNVAADTYVLQKPELQSPCTSDEYSMKSLKSRLPLWLAVLVLTLIFGSIPATLAYRSIHRFQINNQILEVSKFVEPMKWKVSRYPDRDIALAPDNAAVGLPEPAAIRSRYVTSLEVSNGTIIVTLGGQVFEELQGKHLLFTYTHEGFDIPLWQCTSADIARELQPIACM